MQRWKVKLLEDSDTRQDWGIQLRQILFKADILEFMDPALRLPGAVYPSIKMVSVRYDDNGMGPDLKMREVE